MLLGSMLKSLRIPCRSLFVCFVAVAGLLVCSSHAWSLGRQLRVHPPSSSAQVKGFSSLLTLLQERGWTVLRGPLPGPSVIHLHFVSSRSILLQKGSFKRKFRIPERYKSVRTRLRSIATFVDLFAEMEPVQRQASNKSNSRLRGSRNRRFSSSGRKASRWRRRARKRRRRVALIRRRRPAKRSLVKKVKPVARMEPKRSLKSKRKVAQVGPGGQVQRPWSPQKSKRSWGIALEGGVMLGFQGEAQLPVGGWLHLAAQWNRWSVRLVWDLGSAVGLSEERGSLLRMRPGLTFGARIVGERFQFHGEAGVLLEGLESAINQQRQWRWRVGGVLAARLHIRLLPRFWFVSRLAFSVFPQTYEFAWQEQLIYRAEPWFVEVGVGLRYELF